jgi:hypothetical protein
VITAPSCVTSSGGTASVLNPSSALSYHWTIQGGTITTSTIGTTVSFEPSGSGPVTLTVAAQNACQAQTSTSKSITVGCGGSPPTAPSIQTQSQLCGNSGGSAYVAAQSGVTHTWSVTGASSVVDLTDNITFIAGASGSVSITVTATNAYGSAQSSTSIPIQAVATATLTAMPDKIVRGASTQLKVTLTGSGPWGLVWDDGRSDTVYASPFYRTVTPTISTTYGLASITSQSCSGTLPPAVLVDVALPATTVVKAETQAPEGTIKITWNPVPGATSYDIRRFTVWNGTSALTSTTATQLVQTVAPTSTPVTYIYTVQAKGGGLSSSAATSDYTTVGATLWSQTVLAGSIIRAADVQELRRAIDAFRFAYGLPKLYTATPAPSGFVAAAQFLDLIAKFNEARITQPAMGDFVYVNVPPPAFKGVILAAHIQQLRAALD